MAILSISIMWIKTGGQRKMSLAWNKNDRCRRSKYKTDESELKSFYSNKNSEFKNYNFIFCKVWVLLGERKEPCCYSLYEWHSISFQKTKQEMPDGVRQAPSIWCKYKYKKQWGIFKVNYVWLVTPLLFLRGKENYCKTGNNAGVCRLAYWVF
jgi:hypothetical protein